MKWLWFFIVVLLLSACSLFQPATAAAPTPEIRTSTNQSSTDSPPLADTAAAPTLPPTDTPTPSLPTNTITPAILAKVTIDNTNLRLGPARSFPVVDTLFKGEIVTLIGRNNDTTWIFVITSIGFKGWVFTENIKSMVNLADLPVSEEVVPSATTTEMPTITKTFTATVTLTPTVTLTLTTTFTRAPSNTPTETVTPSKTPTETLTVTPSLTRTYTLTPSLTPTRTRTATPNWSPTPSPIISPSPQFIK